MKVAIIGSRNLKIENLEKYLPRKTDEIVSGGASGIDACAARWAKEHSLTLTEFLPQYEKYGRAAPILRNRQIAEYADCAIAFWDGRSRGTKYTVQEFKKQGKEVWVYLYASSNPLEYTLVKSE